MLNVLGGEGREREVLLYRSPSVFFKLLFSSLPPQWIVAVECIEGVGPQFRPPFFFVSSFPRKSSSRSLFSPPELPGLK